MTIRRSALPVRMSYSVNVRSEPILASTEDSDRLNRTAVMVSVEVGNVRFEMAALLVNCQYSESRAYSRSHVLGLIPYLHRIRGSREYGVRTVVIY